MSIHEAFPYLRAENAKKAISFYSDVFGVTEKYRLEEPNGRIGHAELQFGESTIMISDPFPDLGINALDPEGPSVNLIHVHVDDADAVVEKALKHGARIVRALEDQFYGERSGTIRDPFGYDWKIGHSIEKVSIDEMKDRYVDGESSA